MVYEKIEIKYKQPLFYDEFLPLDTQEWYVLYRILKAEIDKIEQLIKPTLPDELRNKSLDEVVKILERKEERQEGRIKIEDILNESPERRREIEKFIVEFIKKKGGEASLEDILEHSKDKYKKEEITEALSRMKRAGIIYEPKATFYKLTEYDT